LTLGGLFERFMVIPASIAAPLFGLLTAWTLGIPLLGFLQGAQSSRLLVSLLLYLSTIRLVPFIFIPRGKVFAAELEVASAQGTVTHGLQVAFADPAVRAAHIYEFAAIIIVLILMVTRPFSWNSNPGVGRRPPLAHKGARHCVPPARSAVSP
jgi:hypothetical protein